MKKSLIALAVLAASGASFAQVSITGNLVYGYQSTTDGGTNGLGGNDQAGFGAETANVLFTATEDLGGGFAAKASMKLRTGPSATNNTAGSAISNTANGDDHTLTLTTPVGALIMGTVLAADYLSGGIAGVGAYYNGWDGTTFTNTNGNKVLSARTNRDMVSFVIPVGAFTFSLTQQEPSNITGLGGGSAGVTASSGTSQGHTILSATYSAGPLTANGQYFNWKNSQSAGMNKDTTRLAANYDLGMVKLGAGTVMTTITPVGTAANVKVTDYLVAAKVPMGASSFGATFVSRQGSDTASIGGTDSTATGYSLEYGYAMSKRTSVIANYARWTAFNPASGVTVGRDASSQLNLLLSHSF